MWSAVVLTVMVAKPLANANVAVATDRPSAVCNCALRVWAPGAGVLDEVGVDGC
jgi:hypothetical protein